MDVRTRLIKELTVEDNYSFLLDLEDLMPQIRIEMIANIIEKELKFTGPWADYKLSRVGDLYNVSKPKYLIPGLFRFSIYFGRRHGDLFYGIRHASKVPNTIFQTNSLLAKCEALKLISWEDWYYRYFTVNETSIFTAIKNGQNTSEFFNDNIASQFFADFTPMISALEEANEVLLQKTT